MDRDAIRILLIARSSHQRGIGSCYVYVKDADALYAELLAEGAAVVAHLQEEPHVNPNTGTREFALRDPDGYYVMISALSAA